jgi:Calx-beta domain
VDISWPRRAVARRNVTWLLATSLFVGAGWIGAAPSADASGVPMVSVSNLTILEGDVGPSSARVQVTLSHASLYSVGITWGTYRMYDPLFHGNAMESTNPYGLPADYELTGGSLVIPPGRVSGFLAIPTYPDTTAEPDESFVVRLSRPWAATISDAFATVTIVDDDSIDGFGLGIGDVSVREGNSKSRVVEIPVVFTGPAPSAFTFTTSTVDGSASGGTGGDFGARVRTQSVATGIRSKVAKVTLRPDSRAEATESFTVSLTSTLGTVVRASATITIRDDEMSVTRPGRVQGPPRIALIGDSITGQYALAAKRLLENAGYAVQVTYGGGEGLLDAAWCQGQWATWMATNYDPDFVVFENTGNFGFTPKCDPATTRNSPEFFVGWEASARLHGDIFTDRGAEVWWVLNPQVPPGAFHDSITGINAIYTTIAADGPLVGTIDLFTPFGGDGAGCAFRAPDCTHLDEVGEQMFADVVSAVFAT